MIFNGSTNDAWFKDCTFSDNLSRAITLAGGASSDTAEYAFDNCLFQRNSVTTASNYGGGAVYISGSYFSIDVTGCMFSENKAVGTGTGHRSNNRVDGGALYVNANGGYNVSLNVHNSYFENNFAQDDGGAILVEGSQTRTSIESSIANCTFFGNTVAGAHYGGTRNVLGFQMTAWCTDGTGGAISYFGLTESEITHCTFYNNGITNELPAGVSGMNLGSAGGGGAIAVDTGYNGTSAAHLPPMPKLTNNIFVGNYVTSPMSQTTIDLVNSFTNNSLGNTTERSRTGNVFVLPITDADFQATDMGSDPRMFVNNGNIGYDNRSSGYKDDGVNETGIQVSNIFASHNNTVNRSDLNTALPEEHGDPVGASGNTVYKKCFIISPTSNELYRGGSVPYVVEVPYDVLGNKRDTFPNAGAVEIYWTMFNPGTGADWTDAVPAEMEDPNDPGERFRVIRSSAFSTNNSYYVMTAVGIPDSPSGYLAAMPRSAIDHSSPYYGFMGWLSSTPDLNWAGYPDWASQNGHSEPTVQDFLDTHPVSDLPKEAFPLYQPGEMIHSAKQTLTAEWLQDLYRVDFDLNYGETPNWYNSSEAGREAPRINIPAGNTILAPSGPVRPDHIFIGWFTDSGCTSVWNFGTDVVTTDTVLYAGWMTETFTVIYHGSGSTNGAAPVDSGSPYDKWSQVTVLGKGTLKRTGFTFDGWSTIPGDAYPAYAEGDMFTIFADTDLYPVWTYAPSGPPTKVPVYHIYASADGGSAIDPAGTVSVGEGGSATFTYSAADGYSITSVVIDGTDHPEFLGTGTYTFSNVRHDHSISIGTHAQKEAVPVNEAGDTGDGKWAVLNLMCAAIALLAGIIGFVSGRGRVRGEEEERRSKTAMILRAAGMILGVVSVIVFFLTEDWTLPVTVADEWTLLTAILLVASAIAVMLSFRFDGPEEE